MGGFQSAAVHSNSANRWSLVSWSSRELDKGPACPRLGPALELARAVAPPARIMVVVLEQERPWWRRALSDHPGHNIVEQPFDRGSGVAILMGVLAIERSDPEAQVSLFGAGEGRGQVVALIDAFRRQAPEVVELCTERLRASPTCPGVLDLVYPHLSCVRFASVWPGGRAS